MTKDALSISAAGRKRGGFTLIELLVVIGIIVLLAGLIFPVLIHVRRNATRTKIASDLQTIGVALEAYKADFGDYPRPSLAIDPATGNAIPSIPDRPNPPLGAQILCRALVGPAPAIEPDPRIAPFKQDGANGPGFRVRTGSPGPDGRWGTPDDVQPQGKVYGPYLATDRFHVGDPASPKTPNSANVLLWTILDSNDQPILYFPAAPQKLRINMTTNYVGKNQTASPQILYMYNLADNLGLQSVSPLDDQVHTIFTRANDNNDAKRMGILLGDYDPANPSASTNYNSGIDGNEHAATTGPYILWSAGPDGIFGTDSITPTAKELQNCDDVTNFNMGTQ